MKETGNKAVCLAALAVDREVCILHHLGMKQQGNQKVDSGNAAADPLTVQM